MKLIHKQLVAASLSGALVLAGFSAIAQPNQAEAANCDVSSARTYLKDFNGNNTWSANYALTGSKMDTVKITNTSKDCTYPVGIASYKAYENYQVSVKSQVYFDSKVVNLKPGQSWTYTVKTPECAYQVDVFYGSLLKNFKTKTYSGEKRLLDAYFYPDGIKKVAYCKETPKPTPTPTATPTPTPTKPTPTPTKPTPTPTKPTPTPTKPTPTPSATPTPTPTATPTPTPVVPTPTPTVTPTPQPTVTPEVLPETGPGVAVALSMIGMVGGLIAYKGRSF